MKTMSKTISKDELIELLKEPGRVQLINVLKPESYTLGMIPGSLKIPVADINRRTGELDRSKEVVTYCAGAQCPASKQAAEMLASKGFQVRAYEGGIQEWKDSGLLTELPTISDPLASMGAQDRPSGLSGMP